MSSLVHKLKGKLNSSSERLTLDEDGNKLSRTNSIRSTLTRTLSKKKKGKEAKGSDASGERYRSHNASSEVVAAQIPESPAAPAVAVELAEEAPAEQDANPIEPANQSSIEPIVLAEPPKDAVSEVSIQGSSTPIQGTTSSDNLKGDEETQDLEDNHTANEDVVPLTETTADETSPLLGPTRSAYTDLEQWAGADDDVLRSRGVFKRFLTFIFQENPWKSLIVLILLVLIAAAMFFTARNISVLLNQAIDPNVQSVSVLGVSDTGISVHVVGSVYVEYEKIPNLFYRYILRTAGLLVGGVTVYPQKIASVYVDGKGITKVHALDVLPPELTVDLTNNRLTQIDFMTEAAFVEEEFAKLANKIMLLDRAKDIPLNLLCVFEPSVVSKWFTYNSGPITVYSDFVLKPHDFEIPLTIDDVNVQMLERSVAVNASLTLREVLPLKLDLPAIDWNIALPNCDDNPVTFGSISSAPISLIPNESAHIEVAGSVFGIPHELLQKCSDGTNPLNRFASLVLDKKALRILMSGSNSERNAKELPKWLYHVLSEVVYDLSVPLPSFEGHQIQLLVRNYTIEGLSLHIDPSDKLEVDAEVNASIAVDLPFGAEGFELELSKIKSTLQLSDYDGLVGISVSKNSQVSLLHPEDETVFDFRSAELNVDVSSPVHVGRAINTFINTGSIVEYPVMDLQIDEVYVKLPIVSTLLRDLHFSNISLSEKVFGLGRNKTESFFDWLLRSMEVGIDQIFYVDSSPQWVELLVDFKISNPLALEIDIPEATLEFEYLYNSTGVGIVSISNVKLPRSNDRLEFSATVKLVCETTQQRVHAEDFISHVISGAEDVFMGIKGSKLLNGALGELLQQIYVPAIKFPGVLFQEPESEVEVAQASPFLVDATIHVLTSEIELTIFNPVSNAELMAEILQSQATYKGETLANIERTELMIVPPGIYKTPRIPIKVASGLGADILRKALNGELFVNVTASIGVRLDRFLAQLLYQGSGVTAKVKL